MFDSSFFQASGSLSVAGQKVPQAAAMGAAGGSGVSGGGAAGGGGGGAASPTSDADADLQERLNNLRRE